VRICLLPSLSLENPLSNLADQAVLESSLTSQTRFFSFPRCWLVFYVALKPTKLPAVTPLSKPRRIPLSHAPFFFVLVLPCDSVTYGTSTPSAKCLADQDCSNAGPAARSSMRAIKQETATAARCGTILHGTSVNDALYTLLTRLP
jgi:hypothetical protein